MVKGIVRQLDHLGRVVIPKEMRKTLKIEPGDPLDIYFCDGVICIDACKLQCSICGAREDASELCDVEGIILCDKCARKIREGYTRCVTR